MENPFFASAWPGVATWIALYISDYALTVKCARLYKTGASERLVMEGSYELTPYYQRDIDSLRLFSPRFVVMLIYGSVLLAVVWMLSLITYPQLYTFSLGSMILIELTVHVRHLHNLVVFRALNRSDGVRGRIEYQRTFILHTSAADLMIFAGLYLALFGCLQNWFFLGGVASCLQTALKHLRLVRKLPATQVGAPDSQTT